MSIGLYIREGLQLIAEEIRATRENREYEKLRGLLTDEDKIRLLKYELYSSTSANVNPEKSQELRKTISLLSNEVERKNNRDNCLQTYLHEGAKTLIGLILLATVGSYVIHLSDICNGRNSQFCRQARIIPQSVENYFSNQYKLEDGSINTIDGAK